MKDIEEQAIRLLIEETKAKDIKEQLLFDEFNYGKVIVYVDEKGNQTRMHPMTVIINEENGK